MHDRDSGPEEVGERAESRVNSRVSPAGLGREYALAFAQRGASVVGKKGASSSLSVHMNSGYQLKCNLRTLSFPTFDGQHGCPSDVVKTRLCSLHPFRFSEYFTVLVL